MGKHIELTASDGHKFAAYRADPAGKPKGGIVVVQEAFGVNAHIREMADKFAKDGYLAIAPALYDRVERGVETDSFTGGSFDFASLTLDDVEVRGVGVEQAKRRFVRPNVVPWTSINAFWGAKEL